jgi:hypothetical protein
MPSTLIPQFLIVLHQSSLQAPPNDVALFLKHLSIYLETLQQALEIKYDHNHFVSLCSPRVDRNAIIEAMRRFATSCGDGDVVIFYYSGHGRRWKSDLSHEKPVKSYCSIVPEAAIRDDPRTEIFLATVASWSKYLIESRKVNSVVLILDACWSGFSFFGTRSDAVAKQLPDGTLATGMVDQLRHCTCSAS